MKTVKAVAPYIHPEQLNFKTAPYKAWMKVGGEVAPAHYPPRLLHGFAFRYEIPRLTFFFNFQSSVFNLSREVRLRFVEPLTLLFDSFPDYATHEIIPFVWDCWPFLYERMYIFIDKYHVQTMIFTSKETANHFKEKYPNKNIMYCPEGIDSSSYLPGEKLDKRTLDLLEFGRPLFKYVKMDTSQYEEMCSSIKYLKTSAFKKRLSDEELHQKLSDTKITICYPHNITEPDWCGGVETLTQRYWECMLSRTIIVGHAPQELIDLIGYNPCIEVEFNGNKIADKTMQILKQLNCYQSLVDKNYETARNVADWTYRMKDVRRFLSNCGYIL